MNNKIRLVRYHVQFRAAESLKRVALIRECDDETFQYLLMEYPFSLHCMPCKVFDKERGVWIDERDYWDPLDSPVGEAAMIFSQTNWPTTPEVKAFLREAVAQDAEIVADDSGIDDLL